MTEHKKTININTLSTEELKSIYIQATNLRKLVLDFVQTYDSQNINSLITKNFEHEIEQVYGMKLLNEHG